MPKLKEFDYSLERKKGNNIYLFRDPYSKNPAAQEDLFQAARKTIDSDLLDTVFLDGMSGKFPQECSGNCDKKCDKSKESQKIESAAQLLYNHYRKRIDIYGIDDEKALQELSDHVLSHNDLVRKFQKNEEKFNSKEDEEEFIFSGIILDELIKQRNPKLIENALGYMNEHGLKNAGLISPEYSFELVAEEFKNKKTGIISYKPNMVKLSYVNPDINKIQFNFN